MKIWPVKLISNPPVASAAFHSKAVVLLLFIHCLLLRQLFVRVYVKPLFYYAVLYVISSFALILLGNTELDAL